MVVQADPFHQIRITVGEGLGSPSVLDWKK